jgi:uncharacterized protein YbjT (DUF2867 family)
MRRVAARLLLAAFALASMVASAQGSPPAPAGDAHAAASHPTDGGVLVFGGTRATGLEIVRLLAKRGEHVTVAVRPTSDTTALRALRVETVVADALSPEQLAKALAGRRFRAAISTLGSTRKDKDRRPDYLGNRNVIDAAKNTGATRFVLITTVGAGDSYETAPWLSRQFLSEVMELKTKAEEHLKASGLDYTIIRPGGLMDKASRSTATLTEDTSLFSWTSRADVARLAVQALYDDRARGKVYHVYDPTRTSFTSMWGD